ncbi:MAG TPA: AAA family ATPase [Flavobacteriaceae bacterium]|nr:AAA family ATPase [Flavobacteriaceae bacterium]
MEELFVVQELLFSQVSAKKRYLLREINWSNRLIGIKGARGTGKTTLLLQRIKFDLLKDEKVEVLYASLDDLYFLQHTLVDLAKEFTLRGGTHLFLDEVHKYPHWSRELKLIYDRYQNLNVVFTSSSMLGVYKGESDLSRRAVTYRLNEFSFREFLHFEQGMELPMFDLEEIIKNHKEIARELKIKLQNAPLKFFRDYFKYGAYPYFLEGKEEYHNKLLRTVNLIIESDMNIVENIAYEDSRNIKKLLVAIAQSAPFTPNVSKLSERLGINRIFLINAIKLLTRADLVMSLFKSTKGVGALTKPEKLYLHNTNLIYALGKEQAEKGALRETFFLNQLSNSHEVHLAEKGDFLIDRKYTFEIGGKNKNTKQIQGIPDAFVVRDDMEVGAMNIIPLWLFGFLY